MAHRIFFLQWSRSFGVAAALCAQVAAQAAPAIPDPLTVEWLVREVLLRQPEVRVKQSAYLAANERVRQAGALDDPTLGVMVDDWSTRRLNSSGVDAAQKMVELSQQFPTPGKRKLRTSIAQREADAASIESDVHHLDLRLQAQEAFYDYLLADQRLTLVQNQRRLWDAYAPAIRMRLQRDAAPRDLALDSARINTQLLEYRYNRRAAVLRINALLARPPESPLPRPYLHAPSEMPAKLEDLIAHARRTAAPLRMADSQAARATAAMDLARRERIPDLTVFTRYNIAGDEDGDDSFRLGASINLPLWAKRKQDRAVAAAAHERDRWQEQRRADEHAVVRDVSIWYEAANSKREALQFYRQDILPRTNQLLNTTMSRYRTSRSDIVQLLEAQQARFSAQLEALALHVDYEKALCVLQRSIGDIAMTADRAASPASDLLEEDYEQ